MRLHRTTRRADNNLAKILAFNTRDLDRALNFPIIDLKMFEGSVLNFGRNPIEITETCQINSWSARH